jgi:hypothetical protein
VPLRLATYLGFVVALSAFGYALHRVVVTLLYGNPVAGYPSLLVIILFLGGVQLMSLGVIGEYVGRIADEVKRRPLYLIDAVYGARDVRAPAAGEGADATADAPPRERAR